jgi:polyhydroxybutyrate depolymerase
VDASRITVTGHSNGAAMSHRLACERADVFAAIVANSGSNQYSTGAPCEPARPISVMQIHGTDDPCWTYETSGRACLTSQDLKLGAVESVEGWAATDGCSTKDEGAVIDNEPDKTAIQSTTWSGCDGGTEVVLLTVIGGGHTWPNGDPGLGRVVGEISTEIDSGTIWEFLSRWSLP